MSQELDPQVDSSKPMAYQIRSVRDLGMPLVSVSPVEHRPPTTLGTGQAGVLDVKSNVGVGGLSTSINLTGR